MHKWCPLLSGYVVDCAQALSKRNCYDHDHQDNFAAACERRVHKTDVDVYINCLRNPIWFINTGPLACHGTYFILNYFETTFLLCSENRLHFSAPGTCYRMFVMGVEFWKPKWVSVVCKSFQIVWPSFLVCLTKSSSIQHIVSCVYRNHKCPSSEEVPFIRNSR